MVLNQQWPFEHAGRNFYAALTEQLVAAAEEMLHHVQPGESACHPIRMNFSADLLLFQHIFIRFLQGPNCSTRFGSGKQCCGSGSVESVSYPDPYKKWLDPESGSVSNNTDPDPTKTIENIK